MNVLITGWTRWIGKSLVKVYLEKWFSVFCIARDKKMLSELENKHKSKSLHTFSCNISSNEDISNLVWRLQELNFHPNILINNVWVGFHENFENIPELKIQEIINTNLLWTILLTKAIIGIWKNTLTNIAFVSSLAGQIGFPWLSVYSASKFGIEWFAQSLREEQKSRVIVSIIRPWIVDTHFFEYANMKQNVEKIRPWMQSPDYVADAIYEWISLNKEDFTIWNDKLFLFLKRFSPKRLEHKLLSLFIH